MKNKNTLYKSKVIILGFGLGMLEIQGLNSINQSYVKNIRNNDSNLYANKNKELEYLSSELEATMDEQGIFSKGWNGLKEIINVGTSEEKCNEFIEKYKKGEISFEEAVEEIEKFNSKQESSLNLFSNIATSILAIAAIGVATVATGGIGLGAAIAIGAGTGAVAKAGMKTLDRATNNVEGDAGNTKTIVKDALSGAVTGGLASVTMGTAGSYAGVKEAVKGCAKTGLKTGTISGAANYTIDCAFEDDKDFKLGDFAKSTAMNAVIGAGVGAVMGSANGFMRANDILHSGCNIQTMINENENIVKDVAANSVCTSEYKILNDRIKSAIA